eukprot:jgi/Mesen1/784/ME000110S_11046
MASSSLERFIVFAPSNVFQDTSRGIFSCHQYRNTCASAYVTCWISKSHDQHEMHRLVGKHRQVPSFHSTRCLRAPAASSSSLHCTNNFCSSIEDNHVKLSGCKAESGGWQVLEEDSSSCFRGSRGRGSAGGSQSAKQGGRLQSARRAGKGVLPVTSDSTSAPDVAGLDQAHGDRWQQEKSSSWSTSNSSSQATSEVTLNQDRSAVVLERTKTTGEGGVSLNERDEVSLNGELWHRQKNGAGSEGSAEGSEGTVDVVTLGNLCVDVLTSVEELPPTARQDKWDYMQRLMASPPEESCWEGGGNSNTAIAAARLGLNCVAIGHVGGDRFGSFLRRVLCEEGIAVHELQQEGAEPIGGDGYDGDTTLACWVMIDPRHQHAFCSRLSEVPAHTATLIRRSRAVFCNGFVFDELPPAGVMAALRVARGHGAAVFFDPGPRTRWLAGGSAEQRAALTELIQLSDVLLLTSDEAEVLTGLSDPMASAQNLLQRGGALQWVVVKRGALGCAMAARDALYCMPGFAVDVADTVGCGDSFAAAVVLGFTRGEAATTTLTLANAVGAATATGLGAGRNVASARKVEEILLRLKENDERRHISIISAVNLDPPAVPSCGEDSVLVKKETSTSDVKLNASQGGCTSVPLGEAVRAALDLLHRSLSASVAS